MKNFHYYKSLRKTIIQFLDMFNDINVAKYDGSGKILEYNPVAIKYGPKNKTYHWLNEKDDRGNIRKDILLPMIGISMENISYSSERVSSLFDNIKVDTNYSTNVISRYLNPIPYDITMELSIWSKYMVDIDQILEQILPYFTPFSFIQVTLPELSTTIENKVILDSCSPSDISKEIGDSDWRNILWSLSFTIQTLIFKPLLDNEEGLKLIKTIFTNFYKDKTSWNNKSSLSLYTSASDLSASWAESLFLRGDGYDNDLNLLYTYEIF